MKLWVDQKSGQSTGTIENQKTLLRSVQTLVNSGVDAVAVVGRFPDDDLQETDEYRQGKVCQCIHCHSTCKRTHKDTFCLSLTILVHYMIQAW